MIVQEAKLKIKRLMQIMPDSRLNSIGSILINMKFYKPNGKKDYLMWEDVEEILEFVTKEREKPSFNYLRDRYGSEEWLQYLRANPEVW
jgi:hypothetical protein|tara:strand:+ start:414 stop:680 length:267 start_codon:yes stop_codon:yes gene_type:complete